MRQIQTILHEIDLLQPNELVMLYQEVERRVRRINKASVILSKYCGRGKGVWLEDAQDYINQLRNDDRF